MKNFTKYQPIIQLLKYAVVGGTATGINYLIFLLLFNYYHVHYLVSSGLAFMISILIGFLIHKYWTFRLHKDAGLLLLKYILVYILSLSLGMGTLHFLVKVFTVEPAWANGIVIIITALFNYLGLRFFAFRK